MKRYDELTPEELLRLSEDPDALARVVDYECAEEGVPLLPPEPTAPEQPEAKPDLDMWQVHLDVLVGSRETAAKLCEEVDSFYDSFYDRVSLSSRYDYSGPYTAELCMNTKEGPLLSPEVTKLWSRRHYAEHKLELTTYKEQKAAYDHRKKEYDNARSARESIESSVRSLVVEAVDDRDDRERARVEFARYVDLAEGDRDIALRFFVKASSWDESWIRETVGMAVEAVEPQCSS